MDIKCLLIKGSPYESGKGKTGINHTNVRNGTGAIPGKASALLNIYN